MANTSELRKCADLQWKLLWLIESAKEGEEARKAHPPPKVDPQTVEMLHKELYQALMRSVIKYIH